MLKKFAVLLFAMFFLFSLGAAEDDIPYCSNPMGHTWWDASGPSGEREFVENTSSGHVYSCFMLRICETCGVSKKIDETFETIPHDYSQFESSNHVGSGYHAYTYNCSYCVFACAGGCGHALCGHTATFMRPCPGPPCENYIDVIPPITPEPTAYLGE